MKVAYKSFAALIVSLQLMAVPALHAEGDKVPDDVVKEVVDQEKQAPEKEKSESGEASGNVKDCEQANETDAASQDVEERDIDDCENLIK